MKSLLSPALAALVLLAALPAHAEAPAEPATRWMKVLLDGRKVGQAQSSRTVEGDRVTSTERMTLVVDRAGISLPVESEETSVETRDGRPLGFISRTRLSGMESTIEGTLGDDGTLSLVLRSGESEQRRSMAWPPGALLVEGARLAEQRHGLAPGTRYELLSFQPATLSAVPVVVSVGDTAPMAIDGKTLDLTRVEQLADLQGAPMRLSAWVDAAHVVHRASLPMMGMSFEMLACDEACAKAPNQPTDILDRAMVAAPRALGAAERAAGLRYTLRTRGADAPSLPSLAEQRSARDGSEWQVTVAPKDDAGGDRVAPSDADLEATRWLNHDDPSVQALARRAAGDAVPTDRALLMDRLEDFVRDYIGTKSMRVGYASAAETVASREGDCTEHAVLLAALGRALGVPTRVVNGLAYAPEFAGRAKVFVPHAWVQAWDGSRWRSYDAALPGFDAGHIALSVGDGDAAGFYAGVALLGNLDVLAVESLAAEAAE